MVNTPTFAKGFSEYFRLTGLPVGEKHSDPYLWIIRVGLWGPPRGLNERVWPRGGLLTVTYATEVSPAAMRRAMEPDRRTIGCFLGVKNVKNHQMHGVTAASRAHRGGGDF